MSKGESIMNIIVTTIVIMILYASPLPSFQSVYPEMDFHSLCPCEFSSMIEGGYEKFSSDRSLWKPFSPPGGKPSFLYETVIPGYYLSHGIDMTVDADKNAYVIGSWYQDHQHLDIIMAKLDAEGSPLWTVTIAGDQYEHDYPMDIVLDSDGNIWVTGWTGSESFPIVDGFDDTLTGFVEAFIMKLDPEDGTILYSTFLGGDYVDYGRGITLNDSGEIYVVGSTGSTDFPTTPDAYQDEPSAPLYIYTDAFITKLSSDGSTILYSTYFGGYKDDRAENVMIDKSGNIIFAGETRAEDFPLVDTIQSEPDDIFISKLSADGRTLLFSTYFGGEEYDGLGGMTLDSEDFVYISGSTQSIYFPTTPGAYQEEFAGEILGCGSPPFEPLYNCDDAFVSKLGTDGSGLVYSTYLGGNRIDYSRDIALDDLKRVYAVGYTSSPDFPPDSIDFSAEIFVSRIDSTGSNLDYSFTVRLWFRRCRSWHHPGQ
jgi:hypothetical protein